MFGNTLICDEEFTELNRVTKNISDYYFKSCIFSGLDFEGGDFGTVMIFCELNACDLYWTIMASGLFVSTKFSGTAFRGLNFAGAKFIECTFVDCDFAKDNLDSDCDFTDAKFIDCIFQNTTGGPTIS